MRIEIPTTKQAYQEFRIWITQFVNTAQILPNVILIFEIKLHSKRANKALCFHIEVVHTTEKQGSCQEVIDWATGKREKILFMEETGKSSVLEIVSQSAAPNF